MISIKVTERESMISFKMSPHQCLGNGLLPELISSSSATSVNWSAAVSKYLCSYNDFCYFQQYSANFRTCFSFVGTTKN